MSNYSTAGSSMGDNANEAIADDLYRIHCYTNTLARLCSSGNSANAIDPDQLEQIFKDIATVTDLGASALYNASEPVKPIIHLAPENALDPEANPDPYQHHSSSVII